MVPRSEWDRAPWNRWSFQNVRALLQTVTVPACPNARSDLPVRMQPVEDVTFVSEGRRATVGAFLEESFTDGFLVLHRGTVVAESYWSGMTERSLHLGQSLSKSITGTLCGILVGQGRLDPDAPLVEYLPEAEGTAYRGAIVRNLLDMTSGVTFDESYTACDSHMAMLDVAAGWKDPPSAEWPSSVWNLFLSLDKRDRPHGERFEYRSIETDVLAFAMERATETPFAELVGRELWGPLGAEADACFTVDPTGYALADGGFNAVLRDFGRFAQLHLDGGRAGTRQILSKTWIEDTRSADHGRFGAPYRAILPRGAYRNQFWVEDESRRALMARGVFGQLVYMDPLANFAAVKLSSWPDFQNPARMRRTLAAVHAIRDALA